jgi:hypothetical protein
MENQEQGVIDFLSEQLKRREDERIRLDDQLVRTYRANLNTLTATWRFIILARAALLGVAVASLQLILRNVSSFLDTSRLVYILESYKGLPTWLLQLVQPLTAAEAAKLVALLITMTVFLAVSIDVVLAFLQKRCRVRGLQTESYLRIEGFFTEIQTWRRWTGLPFWIARAGMILFGIVALGYLGWPISN